MKSKGFSILQALWVQAHANVFVAGFAARFAVRHADNLIFLTRMQLLGPTATECGSGRTKLVQVATDRKFAFLRPDDAQHVG